MRLSFLTLYLYLLSTSVFAQQKPNIVIILTDDLDAFITPQFFPELVPVVDSLKKTGINFTNGFTPFSICCPSRAAMLSGKNADKTKVLRNMRENGGWPAFKDDEPKALPAQLIKAGYRTVMLGKYLNRYDRKGKHLPHLPYGWTDGAVLIDHSRVPYRGQEYNLQEWSKGAKINDTLWDSPNRKMQYYGKSPEDYSTDVVTRKTVSFINEAESADAQPFFMYICPTAPHYPLRAAERYEAIAKERWLNTTVPVFPNSFNDYGKYATEAEKDIPLDKPTWLRDTWRKRIRQEGKGRGLYSLSYKTSFHKSMPREITGFNHGFWYDRMGSMYAINDLVRETINALKANGEWDNTLLIFTSDNGFQFGNHGLYHKFSPYEEAIRVPLIITAGDSLRIKAGVEMSEWITNLDFFPTILDLAGIETEPDVDGKSMISLIQQNPEKAYNPRDYFILEYQGPGAIDSDLFGAKKLIKHMQSFVSDNPSYNAIRMIKDVEENGVKTEKVFIYIEWEKEFGMVKFKSRLQNKDPKLMTKIEAGNKRLLKKKAKAEAIDTELYCITDDPYEMDNLLYYKPEQYKPMAEQMQKKLYLEINKKTLNNPTPAP